VLEHLGAIHALERARREGQLDRVTLRESDARSQACARPLEQHVREVQTVSPTGRQTGQQMSGAAADLEDAISHLRSQQGPDAADALSLDPANQCTGMIVKAIEIVLGDHRIVPLPDLGAAPECPPCHDYTV
jgi:hypothetical protein